MRKISTSLLLVLLLGGCAKTLPFGTNPDAAIASSDVTIVDAKVLPAPDGTSAAGESRPYVIGPFDKLMIDVYGITELSNREVQADSSGRISFPLAGVVMAEGLSPQELEGVLTARLRENFIRNPRVTVNLKESISQLVTVDGSVRTPGQFPIIGKMSLMRAIAAAKGADENAKLEDVVVFRTVKGQKMAALFNLKAIRRGYYEDPDIYANDVVVVGESTARRLFRDIVQASSLLTTPMIVLLNKI